MISTETTAFIFICSFVGALIGYLIVHHLTIGRDRRREFNDLINPVRRELLGVRNHPGSNLTGAWAITFAQIRETLPFWKRKGFDRAIESYKKSKGEDNQERDSMGGFSYKDPDRIIHAADDLLRFVKLR